MVCPPPPPRPPLRRRLALAAPNSPLTLATAVLFAVLAARLPAQDPSAGVTWGPWYAAGPFDHPKGHTDVTPEHKPEKSLRKMKPGKQWPALQDEYTGKGKARFAWKPIGAPAGPATAADVGVIEFAKVLTAPARVTGWNEQAVAYLYRQVHTSAATLLKVTFGSDDGVALWLNGEMLLSRTIGRGVNPKDESVFLSLKPGNNHLLVKVNNGGGAWGFQLQRWEHVTQDQINTAIDRGVKWLLERQLLDGSWGQDQGGYRNGTTALAIYTLAKSGVSPRHPAILEGLAYLGESATARTYSIGCHMMALEALHNDEYLPWMEELLGDLISWQSRSSGTWGYPHGNPDLSCTQFAALGLRAAAESGLEVPQKVWVNLANGVLDHQLKQQKVEVKLTEKYGNRRDIAGFSYRPVNPKRDTGSMTVAGIATLMICRKGLGDRLDSRLASKIDKQIDYGLNWLTQYWSVSGNPRVGRNWLYYYLYGVERVGSVLDIESIGHYEWYWEGAEVILNNQDKEGGWSDPWGRSQSATCFAVLFLERATRAAVTDPHGRKKKRLTKSDPKAGPMELHVITGSPASFWVHRIDQAALETHQITEVEYWARQPQGEWTMVYNSLPPEEPTSTVRYSGRYVFEKTGTWEMRAVALCDGNARLRSGIALVEIDETTASNISSYPTDARRNLVPRNQPSVTASSGGNPQMVADNRYYSRWVCAPNDQAPEISVELRRAVKADKLLFSHARTITAEQQNNPRAKRLRIWLDRDDPIEVEVDPHYRSKTEVRFPEARNLRKLRVQILEVEGGQLGAAAVGFTEIEVQGPRQRRRSRGN